MELLGAKGLALCRGLAIGLRRSRILGHRGSGRRGEQRQVMADYADGALGLLFIARVSAKLNLFLGVPRINTEFLPLALSHVPSHFRIARMIVLFPVSVIGLGWITLWGAEHIMMATSRPDVIGYSLFTALAALALLEHLFMVVPLPDAKLWRWLLPASGTDR